MYLEVQCIVYMRKLRSFHFTLSSLTLSGMNHVLSKWNNRTIDESFYLLLRIVLMRISSYKQCSLFAKKKKMLIYHKHYVRTSNISRLKKTLLISIQRVLYREFIVIHWRIDNKKKIMIVLNIIIICHFRHVKKDWNAVYYELLIYWIYLLLNKLLSQHFCCIKTKKKEFL